MIWFLLGILLLLTALTLWLGGGKLPDPDPEPLPPSDHEPSPEHREALRRIRDMNRAGKGLRGKARLQAMRRFMDSLGDDLEPVSDFHAPAGTEPHGEWVTAPNARSAKRILYIHGGAWVAGSPRSHRPITVRLSRLTGASVFAVDYRLMPEHRYMDGVRDCRNAYIWLLSNGPDAVEDAGFVAIAGDSAGGNHTLSLLAWIRNHGLRQPDAAVALSPSTDMTFSAPSIQRNIGTDPLLGPPSRPLTRIPQPLLWWAIFLVFRVAPSSPVISPLRADLSGLPPTLIHVSDSEMLLDDARRYVTRARTAGSPAELRIWPGMFHVWHIFAPLLPEAEQALEDIKDFLNRV